MAAFRSISGISHSPMGTFLRAASARYTCRAFSPVPSIDWGPSTIDFSRWRIYSRKGGSEIDPKESKKKKFDIFLTNRFCLINTCFRFTFQ